MQIFLLLLLAAKVFVCAEQHEQGEESELTNEFAVHILGGIHKAHEFARRHNLDFVAPVFDDHYVFKASISRHRRDTSGLHSDLHSSLSQDEQVLWFEQQRVLKRSKRDFLDELHDLESSKHIRAPLKDKVSLQNTTDFVIAAKVPPFVAPNDPLWNKQWYMHRSSSGKDRSKDDMNIIGAWQLGYTGKGVVVTILDDGIESTHVDLKSNYDAAASYDINDNDIDPMPRYDRANTNKHGTRCAGEVAAERGNNACIVGVAFNSRVGGVRMLDGKITDSVEARSISHKPSHVDIYSSSWGPDDDGKTVDGPKSLALKAFTDGARMGRGGLGSIFVWASGNGGGQDDDCNCDGYTTSVYTLSIGSTSEHENFPWYSERCSSTLAVTYSSGNVGEQQIVTTDLKSKCTEKHSGTSASAPLAAGICALVLEANPKLTWRDMQHIVVLTARPLIEENGLSKMTPKSPDEWKKNAVGRWYSHSYGYGLMDAAGMVQAALSWPTVPPQRLCTRSLLKAHIAVKPGGKAKTSLDSMSCMSQPTSSQDAKAGPVLYLEHVVCRITLAMSGNRGKLSIMLTSPQGTTSRLLFTRRKDASRAGFHDWQFMSVHFWGEAPNGTWFLGVENTDSSAQATLSDWKLLLYGTTEQPASGLNSSIPRTVFQYHHNSDSSAAAAASPRGARPPSHLSAARDGSRDIEAGRPSRHGLIAAVALAFFLLTILSASLFLSSKRRVNTLFKGVCAIVAVMLIWAMVVGSPF